MKEELTLLANGNAVTGWTEIEVTRTVERVPNGFSIGLSSRDPGGKSRPVIRSGDPCQIKLGADLVFTGYADRVTNSATPDDHRLMISGRGKCQDLVDCSAEWPSGQLINGTALDIALKLAKPYGIGVKLAPGSKVGKEVPQFLLSYGETPMEIIDRITRAAQLIPYETPEGDLLLATVSTDPAVDGVEYGRNVEQSSVTYAMDQRYSDIVCEQLPIDIWGDLGDGSLEFGKVSDPNVKRHRQLYLVMEQISQGKELCEQKAQWEMARRAGRGTRVQATVDSWRDTAGKLWAPNTLCNVKDLPGLDTGGELAIAEVTYRRNEEHGTTAELLLMLPEAFAPEPIILQPLPIVEADADPGAA